MIFDLRYLKSSAPLETAIDPMFLRFIPTYSNRICVVSQVVISVISAPWKGMIYKNSNLCDLPLFLLQEAKLGLLALYVCFVYSCVLYVCVFSHVSCVCLFYLFCILCLGCIFVCMFAHQKLANSCLPEKWISRQGWYKWWSCWKVPE